MDNRDGAKGDLEQMGGFVRKETWNDLGPKDNLRVPPRRKGCLPGIPQARGNGGGSIRGEMNEKKRGRSSGSDISGTRQKYALEKDQ